MKVTVRLTTKPGAKKTTVKYVDLGGSYSYHTDRSQYIMSQALPLLRQEFLAAQSANVEMISGATDTSQAFAAVAPVGAREAQRLTAGDAPPSP